MQIKETGFSWNGRLTERNRTERIILHHRAGNGDVVSIHSEHIRQGYTGIGYHFYIRKDGSIYRGRPQNTMGAHCIGYNSSSVGICFEGNFETELMYDVQRKAGTELIEYIKKIYPNAKVYAHRELCQTLCPGKNFPLSEIKSDISENSPTALVSANDITWELAQKITIDDRDGFVRALEEAKINNSPLYWGFYKVVNSRI